MSTNASGYNAAGFNAAAGAFLVLAEASWAASASLPTDFPGTRRLGASTAFTSEADVTQATAVRKRGADTAWVTQSWPINPKVFFYWAPDQEHATTVDWGNTSSLFAPTSPLIEVTTLWSGTASATFTPLPDYVDSTWTGIGLNVGDLNFVATKVQAASVLFEGLGTPAFGGAKADRFVQADWFGSESNFYPQETHEISGGATISEVQVDLDATAAWSTVPEDVRVEVWNIQMEGVSSLLIDVLRIRHTNSVFSCKGTTEFVADRFKPATTLWTAAINYTNTSVTIIPDSVTWSGVAGIQLPTLTERGTTQELNSVASTEIPVTVGRGGKTLWSASLTTTISSDVFVPASMVVHVIADTVMAAGKLLLAETDFDGLGSTLVAPAVLSRTPAPETRYFTLPARESTFVVPGPSRVFKVAA